MVKKTKQKITVAKTDAKTAQNQHFGDVTPHNIALKRAVMVTQ